MAKIVSITYKPVAEKPTDAFARVTLDSATLVENYGIEGDRKGGHPKRQINIMSQQTLDALAGYKVAPGEMGEQLVVDGLDVDALPAGARLRLGDEAVLEIVEARTGCDRFEHIQGAAAPDNQLGMMARVVRGGQIAVGAPVEVLDE